MIGANAARFDERALRARSYRLFRAVTGPDPIQRSCLSGIGTRFELSMPLDHAVLKRERARMNLRLGLSRASASRGNAPKCQLIIRQMNDKLMLNNY